MLAPIFAMYGKELFSVHARFEGDPGRISSSGDQGLRGYTEKKWFPYIGTEGALVRTFDPARVPQAKSRQERVDRCPKHIKHGYHFFDSIILSKTSPSPEVLA